MVCAVAFVSTGLRSIGGGTEFVTVVNEGKARYFFRQFVKTTATREEARLRWRGRERLGRSVTFDHSRGGGGGGGRRRKRKEKEREREKGKKPRRGDKGKLGSRRLSKHAATQARRHASSAEIRTLRIRVMRVARRNAHRRHVIQARIRIPRYLAGVGKRLRCRDPTYQYLSIVRLRTCLRTRIVSRGATRLVRWCGGPIGSVEGTGGGKVMEKR